MRKKKTQYLVGELPHRRTEAAYMGALLSAVPLEDWQAIVKAAVNAAKAGDAGARAWLGQYLIGKPTVTALSPLTVIVQAVSGRDPLIESLAAPHFDRGDGTYFGEPDEAFNEGVRNDVAAELRALEAGGGNAGSSERAPGSRSSEEASNA